MSTKVNILLNAEDEATEIHLMDAHLDPIRKGISQLKATVEHGLYKARFVTGVSVREVLIDASEGKKQVSFTQPRMRVRSAAPMPSVTRSAVAAGVNEPSPSEVLRANQISFAQTIAASNGPMGKGQSHLFLFIRKMDSDLQWPDVRDVRILDLAGNEVTRMGNGLVQDMHACAGVDHQVPPGTYRIVVDAGKAGSYEMCVSTVADHQTQVFLMVENFPSPDGPVPSPSLRNSAVLMTRGCGYDPSRPDMRLSEIAKISMVRRRRVADERAIMLMISKEYSNPLLGVFAAHIYMQENDGMKRDRKILHQIMEYLGHVAKGHPDVMALQLAVLPKAATRDLMFTAPPLLYSSWEIITKRSVGGREHVVNDSVLHRMATRALISRPWLIFESGVEQDQHMRPGGKRANVLGLVKKVMAADKEDLMQIVEQLPPNAMGMVQRKIVEALIPAAEMRPSLKMSRKKLEEFSEEASQQFFSSIALPGDIKSEAFEHLASELRKGRETD